MANNDERISFNVTRSIWRLNRAYNGWQKEVNMVAWSGNKPKLDIREWTIDKTKMRRGVTLSKEEVLELRRCLNEIDLDWLFENAAGSQTVEVGPGPVNAGIMTQPTAEVALPAEEAMEPPTTKGTTEFAPDDITETEDSPPEASEQATPNPDSDPDNLFED